MDMENKSFDILVPINVERSNHIIITLLPEAVKDILDEIVKMRTRGLDVTGVIVNEKAFTTKSSYADFHRVLERFNQRMIGTIFGCKVFLYLGAPRVFAIGE